MRGRQPLRGAGGRTARDSRRKEIGMACRPPPRFTSSSTAASGVDLSGDTGYVPEGPSGDPRVDREGVRAGVDHPEMSQSEVLQGGSHGPGHPRSVGEPESEPEPMPPVDEEQIQLGASVS